MDHPFLKILPRWGQFVKNCSHLEDLRNMNGKNIHFIDQYLKLMNLLNYWFFIYRKRKYRDMRYLLVPSSCALYLFSGFP